MKPTDRQKKYTGRDDADSTHWEYCRRHRLPYVTVTRTGKNQVLIAYDVADLDCDLQAVSEQVHTWFCAYRSFFVREGGFGCAYETGTYFFCFPVLPQHERCIAEGLFDFLAAQIR